jgi:hypothetical protein
MSKLKRIFKMKTNKTLPKTHNIATRKIKWVDYIIN